MPPSDPQALAERLTGYRIDRVTIGDREYEGPGIVAYLPTKGRPYWMFEIWGQHTIICAHTAVCMEVSGLVSEVEEEMPEEE